ncbi:hypothetical protein JOD54_004654 [Actinokineospora baliensis]|uniref:ATP-binding protein n=1 Tax=Actinokineospora baliensis TaxID=547056 RepID=UPI00195B6E97|nr:ATP-binding protein [Actinokineospora baliensis]MBM7774450.1 hypothetical protein [Actinokineospora baliensis]
MTDFVANTARGQVSGVVVQAATITGGVHHHGLRSGGVAIVTAVRPAEAAAGLVGRDEEIRRLLDLLDPATPPGPVLLSAVAGMGGIGKEVLHELDTRGQAVCPGWRSRPGHLEPRPEPTRC